MTKVGNSITDLIGKTPIVKLNRTAGPDDAEIYLKLEYFNPGSSKRSDRACDDRSCRTGREN